MKNEIIKVAVNGASGKMGQYVLGAISSSDDMELSFGIDKKPRQIELDKISIPIFDSLDLKSNKADVVVDFTNSEATMSIINECAINQVDIIIGSTGFSSKQIDELKTISKTYNFTVFLVPNFSIGANLLMKMVKEISNYYDFSDVTEMHHENKIDAPSGTAISIMQSILEGKKNGKFKQNIPERESILNTRGGDYEGINIHSRRMPGYVAHHEVVFGSLGETLTLRHDSIDRKSFMPGVLRAVRKIKSLQGFVYGLDNVL